MSRGMNRIVGMAVLLAAGLALSACEDFDMDKLDVFHLNDKKKLPGERKDIFPGGVPGVTEGVPPDLVKGHQAPPDTDTATALPGDNEAAKKAAAIEPQDEPKPKAKPASKPKPRVAKRAPVRVTAKPAAQSATKTPVQPTEAAGTQAAWPAANPQPQAAGAQTPWPSAAPQQPSPWPSAPAPGTFSR